VEDNASDGHRQASAGAAAAKAAAAAAAAAARDTKVSTLMLQNLPRNIRQVVLARTIALMGFADKIDFLYVPSAFSTIRAMGLAFVNFSSPADAENFAKAWFQGQPLGSGVKGTHHVRILPASTQGYAANVATWEKTTRQRIRNLRHRPLVANGEGMLVPLQHLHQAGEHWNDICQDFQHIV
jgi:hypothetical protein